MDERQRFVKIRKIFYEIVNEEVTFYFSTRGLSPFAKTFPRESKVVFCNYNCELSFFDDNRYKLLRNGEANGQQFTIIPVMPITWPITFIIQPLGKEQYLFWLSLDNPKSTSHDKSYFAKKPRSIGEAEPRPEVYRFEGKSMLESEEFKKYFLQMVEDFDPERLEEIRSLLA